jgi:amino acid transporter
MILAAGYRCVLSLFPTLHNLLTSSTSHAVFGTGMFSAISCICASSRMTWAFARDNALPFSPFFSRLSTKGAVPVHALMLSTAIQLVLGLLFLGSSTAFNAFIGVAVVCLGASYAMPIVISLANGRRGVQDAPWSFQGAHAGPLGVIVNVLAVGWVLFEIVLCCMPAIVPVTKVSMSCVFYSSALIRLTMESLDYASVVFVGFAAISAFWYLTSTSTYLPAKRKSQPFCSVRWSILLCRTAASRERDDD